MAKIKLEIFPTDRTCGAEIRGVDLSQDLDDATFEAIQQAIGAHDVIFFRDQDVPPHQLVKFSKRFGPIERHVRQEFALDGYPEIHVLSNIKDTEGKGIGSAYAGDMWHTDQCFKKKPNWLSILHAIEIPMKDGVALGDTMFCSTAHAYETLDDETKEKINDIRSIMQYNRRQEMKRQQALQADYKRPPLTEEQKRATPDITQPVVRTHNVTGRKAIYVNETYTFGIEGMDDAEAQPLLRRLQDHCLTEDNIYRHSWRKGDVVIWDNITTQHKAIGDYALPLRRKMHRTTVEGFEVI